MSDSINDNNWDLSKIITLQKFSHQPLKISSRFIARTDNMYNKIVIYWRMIQQFIADSGLSFRRNWSNTFSNIYMVVYMIGEEEEFWDNKYDKISDRDTTNAKKIWQCFTLVWFCFMFTLRLNEISYVSCFIAPLECEDYIAFVIDY